MNSWTKFRFVYYHIEQIIYNRGWLEEWQVRAAYRRYLQVTGEEALP